MAMRQIKIIFLIFLIFCSYLFLSSKVTGTIPQLGGYQFVTVLTGSMNPEIKAGSLIVIKEISDPTRLKVNDIITFKALKSDEQIITHRIVDVHNNVSEIFFLTKGDSNLTNDGEQVPTSHVLGKYQDLAIPYVGFILHLLKTKLGFFIFFLIPLFILLLPTIKSLNRLKKIAVTNR